VIVKVRWDLQYILFNFFIHMFFNTGWQWSSIWFINNIFISITVLETNIQKKDHCMKFCPLWIKCSLWPPLWLTTSGNCFSTSCDVDYLTAHILSYLNAGLND
jgi:hypothetical protein